MNERVCREALVMPSSTGWPAAGFLPSSTAAALISSISLWSTCSPCKQLGLAGVVDLDLLQHLADDHLDVLVVDLDALQPVDLLDFVDQIGGQFLDALDGEDVVRGGIAVDDVVALLDDVAILQMDVLALRDQVLARLLALVVRLDGDAALVLVVLAEPHGAADFGDDRRILRLARLEQLRHPRQTAGDVARLGAFGRDTRDHVARLHVAPGSTERIASTASR